MKELSAAANLFEAEEESRGCASQSPWNDEEDPGTETSSFAWLVNLSPTLRLPPVPAGKFEESFRVLISCRGPTGNHADTLFGFSMR